MRDVFRDDRPHFPSRCSHIKSTAASLSVSHLPLQHAAALASTLSRWFTHPALVTHTLRVRALLLDQLELFISENGLEKQPERDQARQDPSLDTAVVPSGRFFSFFSSFFFLFSTLLVPADRQRGDCLSTLWSCEYLEHRFLLHDNLLVFSTEWKSKLIVSVSAGK